MAIRYNPSDHFEIKAWDVEFRRDSVRTLMARIYQPLGNGPFPALLDVHGGAWNNGDRMSNKEIDERLAASGILAVAIDLRLAQEAPYPASVADAHYGIRWLKAKAREWNGDPATVGVLGSSSGGYVVELIAMRPHDPQYNSIPLPEAPGVDATLSYVVTRSPVSDPFVRFQHAEKMGREDMLQRTKRYFDPWETIIQGNPQKILDRGEAGKLTPLLVLQGGADDNVLPELQQKFVDSYRAAGGQCDFEIFPGCEHQWVRKPGPETDRAIEMMKTFIARQLKTLPQG
ncbi:MAG: alpha/beta hydrolase [Candidatus Binatia bacterium]